MPEKTVIEYVFGLTVAGWLGMITRSVLNSATKNELKDLAKDLKDDIKYIRDRVDDLHNKK